MVIERSKERRREREREREKTETRLERREWETKTTDRVDGEELRI